MKAFSWMIVRVVCLISIGLFLLSRTSPTPVERNRLELHDVRLFLDENRTVLGLELTGDNIYPDVVSDIAAIRSVTSVRLINLTCTDELIAAITELPQLKTFVCIECKISDQQLSLFRGTRLRSLDFSRSEGLLKGLAGLGQQNELTEVQLDGCQWVSSGDLEFLSGLPQLQTLVLTGTPVTDDGIAKLQSCKRLQRLNLSACGLLTDTALNCLRDCPAMIHVQMGGVSISLKAASEFIAARPETGLSYDQFLAPDLRLLIQQHSPDSGIQALTVSTQLPPGNIGSVTLNVMESADLSLLECLPQLEGLGLTGPGVDDSILPVMRKMKNLKGLSLAGSRFSPAALEALPTYEGLESVNLSRCTIDAATLRWLGKLSSLSRLHLCESTISGELSEDRLTFPKLGFLDLSEAVYATRLLRILDAPGLARLRLASCQLSDDDIASLSKFSALYTLDLSGNPLDGHGLSALSSTSLVNLRLHQTGLTDSGLKTIASLQSLQALDVSNTSISGTGLDFLSERPIYWLNLSHVRLSNDGVIALQRLSSLKSLGLEFAELPADSLKRILQSVSLGRLSVDSQLLIGQHLQVDDVPAELSTLIVYNPDEKALAALESFPNLRWIGLSDCEIDTTTATIIAGHANCRMLDLRDCGLSNEALQILATSESLEAITVKGIDTGNLDPAAGGVTNPDLQFHIANSERKMPVFSEWVVW